MTLENIGDFWQYLCSTAVRLEIKGALSGTGTIIRNENGSMLILTCGHVVSPLLHDPSRQLSVEFYNGHVSHVFKVITSLEDANVEVGLLYGYDPMVATMPAARCLDPERKAVGTKIYIGSFAYGNKYINAVKGRISNPEVNGEWIFKKEPEFRKLIALDVSVVGGSSGAGVFDRSGSIVALFFLCHNGFVKFMPMKREFSNREFEYRGVFDGVIKYALPTSELVSFLGNFCTSKGLGQLVTTEEKLDGILKFCQKGKDRDKGGGGGSSLGMKEWKSTGGPVLKKSKQKFTHQVLPLARKLFTPQKQREILYQSLCVMPLKLIERVFPWLVRSLGDEEAKYFLKNMHMAAPAADAALVTLFSGWACKGSEMNFCLSSSAIAGCPARHSHGEDDEEPARKCTPCLSNGDKAATVYEDDNDRPFKQGDITSREEFDNFEDKKRGDSQRLSCATLSCCVPGLGVNNGNLVVSSPTSLHSSSLSATAPSLNSSLFNCETKISISDIGSPTRLIDNIFKFHKAICKDLEYLDAESGRLSECDEAFLRQFSGQFQLLWRLYKAHSNAEDDIVFPALESKDALHNVYHSYTLDHKQEEMLFEDISSALSELSCLFKALSRSSAADAPPGDSDAGESSDHLRKYHELATKLQGMCKSIIDVFRKELELWPLFDKHFSVEDQDKIVGCKIGNTGAEVLQSMLPWVTSALTQQEQNKMIVKNATKNTMFSEWLNEWWERATPQQFSASELSSTQGQDVCDALDSSDQTFKPGWKDIFRMNQNELESAIFKVSRDSSLDPRRKVYLLQNLMTRCWIAAQQRPTHGGISESSIGDDLLGCSPLYRDSEKKVFGCEHYKRNCKLRAACCGKLFECRFCHDKVSDHSTDRKATTEMMCMQCCKIQPVGLVCTTPSCNGLSMAQYYYNICIFFDYERSVYHCLFCNLCRVGKGLGSDFFNCMTCNCCLSLKLVDQKCREKGLETNCPIAVISYSRQAHLSELFPVAIICIQLASRRILAATIFVQFVANPWEIWRFILVCLMRCWLLNSCLKNIEIVVRTYFATTGRKGTARFHWLYHKCGLCGSFNTRVIKMTDYNSLT